jgi:predicted permease
MNVFARLRAFFRKEKLDHDMAEEMRFHLAQRAADHVEDGMSPDEARHAAHRKFGGIEQIKEFARDQRGGLWLDQFFQDLRYATRTLAKAPRHTAIAVFTLALGIGLGAIQFSIVNGVQRGLPFENAGRIALVQPRNASGRVQAARLADISTWRETQRSFEQLAAFTRTTLEIGGENLGTRSYRGAAFSAGLVEMLGVRTVLGRTFTLDDERTDAPPVLLLREWVWRDDFGGDPAIVGRTVRLRGEPATIVGVLPDGFGFPENEHVWVNLRPTVAPGASRAGAANSASLLGLLRAGVTMNTAQTEFDVLVRQVEVDRAAAATGPSRAFVRPVIDSDGGKVGVLALALLGVVGGVLALACLNVANLLSARAVQRGPELAVRSALGASRGRLVRQLLTESLLLALLGAVGGVLLAYWGVLLLNRQFAAIPDKPFWFVVDLDQRVLLFAIAITGVVGLLSGLFPALRATRRGAGEMIKDASGGGGQGFRLGRINRGLVVGQLTLSCAVLVITSVFVNALWQKSRIALPFDAEAVQSAELRLATAGFATPAARARFYDELLQRARALPGVTAATLTDRYPVERSGVYMAIELADGEAPRDGIGVAVSDAVAPGFFRDLQIPLREGREFAEGDGPGSERVAVVNESFARMAWPGESAVGKRFRPASAKPDEPWLTVVGVVTDLPSDRTPRASAYYHVPLRQQLPAEVLWYVRTAGDVHLAVRPLRELVRSLSADVPVDRPMTLGARIRETIVPLRIFGGLGLAFGASALFLAAVGIYGMTAFAVQQRTREFGIRLALGAKPADLLAFVMRQGTRQLAMGLAIGLLLGWAGSQPVGKSLSGHVNSMGVLVYGLVLAVISAAAGIALWLPARRAAKVDPMVALRAE